MLTLKTDQMEITLGSEASWTIMTLEYDGTPLIIKAGGQGAVIRPAGADWIGGAMSGGVEQVGELTIAADGQPVQLPTAEPVQSNNILIRKTSTLATIEHTAETTVEADLIVQTHTFVATEDIELGSFYCFIYSVAPTTTHWMAQPVSGAMMDGECKSEGGHAANKPVRWLAQYDASAAKGLICYYPTPFTGPGSFSAVWDQESYHKFLAQPLTGKIEKGTQLSYTMVMKMFSAKSLREARSVISSAHINYDTLFDWIYENLPTVLDHPSELAEGLDALSRADMFQTRGKTSQDYRLLKYMFNSMTGGVSMARRKSEGAGLLKLVAATVQSLGYPLNDFMIMETKDGVEIKPVKYLKNDWRKVNTAFKGIGAEYLRGTGRWRLPYFRPPGLKWRYIKTYHSRRRLRSVADKVAQLCHIGRKEAIAEVIPLIKVIYKDDKTMGEDLANWLELEKNEVDWLKKG